MDKNNKFLEIIETATLAPSSKKQYSTRLNKLSQSFQHDIEWFIDHHEDFKNAIWDKYSEPQTRKIYVNSIIVLFKYSETLKDEKPESYSAFYRMLTEVANACASAGKKEVLISWEDVLAVRDTLANDQYASIPHLLLSMYTFIPPRRQEFFNVPISDKVLQEGVLGIEGETIEVPYELLSIIKKSLEIYPRNVLIPDSKGKPYENKNSFIAFVNRTLAKVLNSNVNTSALRDAYVKFHCRRINTRCLYFEGDVEYYNLINRYAPSTL